MNELIQTRMVDGSRKWYMAVESVVQLKYLKQAQALDRWRPHILTSH